VAAVVTLDASGRCQAARVALLSVGDGPVLASEAATVLAGQAPAAELARAAGERAASRDVDPPSDIHASAAYRRRLVAVLTRRALERAFERAEKGSGERGAVPSDRKPSSSRRGRVPPARSPPPQPR